MRRMHGALALIAVAAAATTLGGCVSLFPKAKPAGLYRFEIAAAQAPATARGAVLIKGPVDFTRAAASDRILTSDGSTIAYIADARWVSSAATLFEEALDRAFETPQAPMLVGRARATPATPVLALDVETFETRYQGGAPHVVVAIRADLVRPSDRATVAEQPFSADVTASDNRVGPIVQAYDAAVAKTLGELVTWATPYAAKAPG